MSGLSPIVEACEAAADSGRRGVLATVAAELSVAILQYWVMDMRYAPSPWLWPRGAGLGVILISVLGVWSCRRVVSHPPVAVLREL